MTLEETLPADESTFVEDPVLDNIGTNDLMGRLYNWLPIWKVVRIILRDATGSGFSYGRCHLFDQKGRTDIFSGTGNI